ncbi:unnamed protein product [Rotaria sp. Silwood2]|nr:unnamed protein product [Rotaria sp. Silwood2]
MWSTISKWDNTDELIFMHDGAPSHYTRTVLNCLDSNFPSKWIGRRGPTSWSPKSPDLTPCDFFLWGWAKEEVYKTNPKTLAELEERIRTVLNNVPQEFLKNSTSNVAVRLQKKDGRCVLVSSKPNQTISGLVVSCVFVDSLLAFSLECFYNTSCIQMHIDCFYYQQCALDQCTDTYEERFNRAYVIATLLGIVGGLSTMLQILIPSNVKLVRR